MKPKKAHTGIGSAQKTKEIQMKGKSILAGVAVVSFGLLPVSAFANSNTATETGASSASAPAYTFKKIATIKLKGPAGHGDLLAYDSATKRIFIAMHHNGVDVVNTKTNKFVKHISNIPEPNGIAIAGDYAYVASAGSTNADDIINTHSLKKIGSVDVHGKTPDGVMINPDTHKLYVGMDDSNWIEMYSIKNPEKPVFKAKFPLYPSSPKSGPDVGTIVPSMNVIFQSDDTYVLKIDAKTGKILSHLDTHIKLKKHGGTKAQYYDSKNDRLWVATTNPHPGVFVINPHAMSVIKTIPESGGGDDGEADPSLGLFYVFSSSSKGFDVYDTNTMTHITHVKSGYGSTHSGVVDTDNNVVYAFGGKGPVLTAYKPVKH